MCLIINLFVHPILSEKNIYVYKYFCRFENFIDFLVNNQIKVSSLLPKKIFYKNSVLHEERRCIIDDSKNKK